MKITKILSFIAIISTIFILAGCSNITSNTPKFEGTWYGIDETRIVKLEIKKQDEQYLVNSTEACYSDFLTKNGDFYYIDFETDKRKNDKYFAKVEKNMLSYQNPLLRMHNLMMNKNGELEGYANVGSSSGAGFITLKNAEKTNLEEMQKTIYEAKKKWYSTTIIKNHKFPDHKFPEPKTTK